MQDEVGKGDGDEPEEFHAHLDAYSSFGEVSFLCNSPQRYNVVVRELCRVLRLDKQSFTEILEIYFLDGRIVLNNLLEVNFFLSSHSFGISTLCLFCLQLAGP